MATNAAVLQFYSRQEYCWGPLVAELLVRRRIVWVNRNFSYVEHIVREEAILRLYHPLCRDLRGQYVRLQVRCLDTLRNEVQRFLDDPFLLRCPCRGELPPDVVGVAHLLERHTVELGPVVSSHALHLIRAPAAICGKT